MATASLTINNQKGSNLYYYLVGPGFSLSNPARTTRSRQARTPLRSRQLLR